MPGVRSALAKVLDYFVFCCSRGLRFGLLEETYNVILINIRREVLAPPRRSSRTAASSA